MRTILGYLIPAAAIATAAALANGGGAPNGAAPANTPALGTGSLLVCGDVPANCGSGTSLSGCTPTISAVGTPSATASSGYVVTASGMDGQRLGGFVYGLTYAPINIGAAQGGTSWWCGPSPRQRVPPFGNTNGAIGACDGSRSRDLNDWLFNNADALGAPYFSGQIIYIQGWNRDGGNASQDLVLTDGLAVTLCP